MRSIVPWNAPTTPAARNAVRRFSCSHGCRNLKLRNHERADALLLLDADHAAGLRADLVGLPLEERLPADHADEAAGRVGDGIGRVVPRHDRAHRVDERRLRIQRERVAQHDLVEPLVGPREEQLAEREDADEPVARIRDEDVRDERALHELAQSLDGGRDGRLRPEHAQGPLHQPADARLVVLQVDAPLLAAPVRRRGDDPVAPLGGELAEDVRRLGGIHERQRPCRDLVALVAQPLRGLRRRERVKLFAQRDGARSVDQDLQPAGRIHASSRFECRGGRDHSWRRKTGNGAVSREP